MEFVPLSKITYIEAQKQYVAVHTDAREYRIKASLAGIEKEPDEYFFKCQRSFVVNLRHVLRIGNGSVVLKNGADIPISEVWHRKSAKRSFACFEVMICFFKNGLTDGSRRTKRACSENTVMKWKACTPKCVAGVTTTTTTSGAAGEHGFGQV